MSEDIKVYTIEEVADILSVTRRTLYNWITGGKIKAFKVGREWRISKEALEEFIKTGTE